jgi:hypothetical protein
MEDELDTDQDKSPRVLTTWQQQYYQLSGPAAERRAV